MYLIANLKCYISFIETMKDAPDSEEVKIMQKCRYWLTKFGWCTTSNVCSYGNIQVPVWLVRLIYLSPMSFSVFLSAWHVIENHFNFTVSSVAMIVIAGAGQIDLIYIVICAQNLALIAMIEELQALVNKRKKLLIIN